MFATRETADQASGKAEGQRIKRGEQIDQALPGLDENATHNSRSSRRMVGINQRHSRQAHLMMCSPNDIIIYTRQNHQQPQREESERVDRNTGQRYCPLKRISRGMCEFGVVECLVLIKTSRKRNL